MSVLYVLIPLAMVFAAGFVGAFVWAVSGGQLDDLETPQHRILLDEAVTLEGSDKRATETPGSRR
jgi:cbb3-type cytochrome oxidase maturation protein